MGRIFLLHCVSSTFCPSSMHHTLRCLRPTPHDAEHYNAQQEIKEIKEMIK
jgi:hypothetical protein